MRFTIVHPTLPLGISWRGSFEARILIHTALGVRFSACDSSNDSNWCKLNLRTSASSARCSVADSTSWFGPGHITAKSETILARLHFRWVKDSASTRTNMIKHVYTVYYWICNLTFKMASFQWFQGLFPITLVISPHLCAAEGFVFSAGSWRSSLREADRESIEHSHCHNFHGKLLAGGIRGRINKGVDRLFDHIVRPESSQYVTVQIDAIRCSLHMVAGNNWPNSCSCQSRMWKSSRHKDCREITVLVKMVFKSGNFTVTR